MNTEIIFALVIAVLFLGSIVWLIIHARREEQKRALGTESEAPVIGRKNKAA